MAETRKGTGLSGDRAFRGVAGGDANVRPMVAPFFRAIGNGEASGTAGVRSSCQQPHSLRKPKFPECGLVNARCRWPQ